MFQIDICDWIGTKLDKWFSVTQVPDAFRQNEGVADQAKNVPYTVPGTV